MAHLSINQESTCCACHLTGTVTIRLSPEYLKELSLFKSFVAGVDGYFLHYHALKTVISNDDAEKLISLGVLAV